MKKRIFSRVLALFMALSLLTTTVFAASLDDLQDAIDGTNQVEVTGDTKPVEAEQVPQPEPTTPDTPEETPAPADDTQDETEPPAALERTPGSDDTHKNGALVRQEELADGTIQNYFGYGWSSAVDENQNKTWYYAIEAHDKDGNRYVVLLDDVSKGNGEGALSGVVIKADKDNPSKVVDIDMNSHEIKGDSNSTVIKVEAGANLDLSNGTISGGQIGIDVLGTLTLDSVTVTNNGIGINVQKDGKVTFIGDNKFIDNGADVAFTLAVGEKEVTYKVDAATAEKLLADKENITDGGDNWKKTSDGSIVLFTGNDTTLSAKTVKAILDGAAKNATGFLIPEGVETIGKSAFYNRKALQTINIPSTVTEIGESAFHQCSNWSSEIKMPDNLKTIGSHAFRNCANVRGSLEFKALETLVDRAFEGCASITGLSFSEGCTLTTIPKNAFNGCSSLGSLGDDVKIPGSVTSIDDAAFNNCSSLQVVTLPENVSRIGTSAFYNCTTLRTLNIPSTVTEIGQSAFMSCSNWSSEIEMPDNLKTIGSHAFRGCKNVTGKLEFKALENLEERAFEGCAGITGLSFSEDCTLTTIPKNAFNGCSSLRSLDGNVKIPSSVTSIGSGAFKSCSILDGVTLPEGVTTIGDNAFNGCEKLKELNIPSSVTTIGAAAFMECQSLTTITIPTSVTEIGNSFLHESGVKSVWVYPDAENKGQATVEALLQPKVAANFNVFVVGNGDAKLYRNGDTVDFGALDKDCFEREDNGEVAVNVTDITSLTITSSDKKTTTVAFGDATGMFVTTYGHLRIPNPGEGMQVTVTDSDRKNWVIDGSDLIISRDGSQAEVSGGGTVTAPDGSATTASDDTAMLIKDGMITANGEVAFTGKDKNTVVITGNGVVVDPADGMVTVPEEGTVDDGQGGRTSYPSGAAIKDGQITSKGDVAVDNGAEGHTVVKPAENGEPVTVDPVTGTTTVPNGGSTFMNDGKNVVSYPDGATVDRQGSATSNSNVVEYAYENSSGTVTTPEGSTITVSSDGTITVPEGSTIGGEGYPYGATILPNGTIVPNPAPPVELPDFTFDSDATGAGTGTTIDDEAIPLAGLISRAQLVSYLYVHEGSPDGEDAEGEYTLAWAWAVENAIEEEKNDPEEIVTVAILREVMTNYAAYLDTTFDVEIEGEDDVPVMNCDEILAEFYASLEDKAA